MRAEDFDRAWRALEADAPSRFAAETDRLVSCAPLCTRDRQGARFYLEAVRGLPTTTEKD